jgi:hypothetical protein
MDWKDVGAWVKKNAGPGAALVGSLLSGNAPGAIAAGVALVSSATGVSEPAAVLERLQTDPQTMVELRRLAVQDQASIREHIRLMHEAEQRDRQAEHKEQQDTIRTGDTADDQYVRHTRPKMARQSWYVTAAYVVAFEALKAGGVFSLGASVELAMLLSAPAWAYLGFRTMDKRAPGALGRLADVARGAR